MLGWLEIASKDEVMRLRMFGSSSSGVCGVGWGRLPYTLGGPCCSFVRSVTYHHVIILTFPRDNLM